MTAFCGIPVSDIVHAYYTDPQSFASAYSHTELGATPMNIRVSEDDEYLTEACEDGYHSCA